MRTDFDIAVIGSGFGGSLLAMIARQQGRSVVLLERGQHPRFAIGESSTPLANLILEELATRYSLPRLAPLTKWGSWQRTYPEVACGLKRGFTFYHHEIGRRWVPELDHSNELLVAASPHDGIADTHWYRPDFDHFLVREAQRVGVDYWDQLDLQRACLADGAATLSGMRLGQEFKVQARFVVDASGPRGFLHRAWQLPERRFDGLPPTEGLYTHFTGVRRWAEVLADFGGEIPPYPVDDAAVHHLFDGGWIWVLRFNNGLTSAGVAATAEFAKELRFAEGARAWNRLLGLLPSVAEQFAGAKAERDFVHAARLSFLSGVASGPNWALLPAAAGFIDPLLSTGFPLNLLGVSRLAEAFERHWGSDRLALAVAEYGSQTLQELTSTAQLIAALYGNLGEFATFAALSLVYFAAASFTESARRLGRPELAGSAFLAGAHPTFGPRSRACFARAMRPLSPVERSELIREIHETVAPLDVAGLTDRSRRNWYGAHAADLVGSSDKLGVERAEIHRLLERCGFSACPT